MAAFIESRVIAFAGVGRVEREKEHSPCRAEALFYSRRMPSFAESFGREDDKAASSFGDGVAAFFFAWAHKGPDARASRPMRSAAVVNARHSRESGMSLREHLKGVITGRLMSAVLP